MSEEAEPWYDAEAGCCLDSLLAHERTHVTTCIKKKERKQNRRTLNVPKVVSSNFSANNVK